MVERLDRIPLPRRRTHGLSGSQQQDSAARQDARNRVAYSQYLGAGWKFTTMLKEILSKITTLNSTHIQGSATAHAIMGTGVHDCFRGANSSCQLCASALAIYYICIYN